MLQADNGISLFASQDTFTDLFVLDSEIRPSGPRAPDDSRLSNIPFTGSIFGDRGIIIRADGDITSVEADNLTRVTIEEVLVRDFAGTVFGTEGLPFSPALTFNSDATYANNGAGVDIATTGDAQLLLDFSDNRILNNGAGRNNDANNNNIFNDQPVAGAEDPNNLLFFDGVKVNAFNNSVISARFVNNLFQDNFERGLGLNTYDSATINASLINNVFDSNDRGEDGNNQTVNNNPNLEADFNAINLNDSDIFDFEAINNEEFNLRPHELALLTDGDGDILDVDEDDIADGTIFDDLPPGFANMCVGLSNNVFQLSVDIADFSTPPGDLRLALDGATNGDGIFAFTATPTNFGICEQLISNEELFFAARGFSAPIH